MSEEKPKPKKTDPCAAFDKALAVVEEFIDAGYATVPSKDYRVRISQLKALAGKR